MLFVLEDYVFKGFIGQSKTKIFLSAWLNSNSVNFCTVNILITYFKQKHLGLNCYFLPFNARITSSIDILAFAAWLHKLFPWAKYMSFNEIFCILSPRKFPYQVTYMNCWVWSTNPGLESWVSFMWFGTDKKMNF